MSDGYFIFELSECIVNGLLIKLTILDVVIHCRREKCDHINEPALIHDDLGERVAFVAAVTIKRRV